MQPSLIENQHNNFLAKPKVIAFDLDLTLHDVIVHYDHSVNETLKHYGHAYLTEEEFVKVGGDNFTSTKDLLANFLPEDVLNQAVEYYLNHFLAREIPINAIFSGAQELLQLVKEKHQLPIIGVTNADERVAIKILHDLDIFKWFDYVVGIKDDTAAKPDPQMLLMGLKLVGIEPSPHVWLVGDRATDTLCAKNVNCSAIRFYHKIKPQDPNADIFINNHYDLFNLIESKLRC